MSELRVTLHPTAQGADHLVAEHPLVPRPDRVSLRYGAQVIEVAAGTPLIEILPTEVHGAPIVAALLGRRPVSLTARVTWDAEIEPITLDMIEGQRVHRMSQALLLLEAAEAIAPGSGVRLAHSVGFGRRVLIGLGWKQRAAELASKLETAMRELVLEDRPLVESWVGVTEAMEHFTRAGWTDTVDLLTTWRDAIVPLASYGSVHAIVMSPLLRARENQRRGECSPTTEGSYCSTVASELQRTTPPARYPTRSNLAAPRWKMPSRSGLPFPACARSRTKRPLPYLDRRSP